MKGHLFAERPSAAIGKKGQSNRYRIKKEMKKKARRKNWQIARMKFVESPVVAKSLVWNLMACRKSWSRVSRVSSQLMNFIEQQYQIAMNESLRLKLYGSWIT